MLLARIASACFSALLVITDGTILGCEKAPENSASAFATPLRGLSQGFAGNASSLAVTNRKAFLGAFFRPQGAPAFGIFSPHSSLIAPVPYPVDATPLLGSNSYCEGEAANGSSIAGSFVVDSAKLANIVNLGVGWTRMSAPQFVADQSHVFGAGQYEFASFDSAQCATFAKYNIIPVVNLEAGPVQYNSVAGRFSPKTYPIYKTPADFGQWCGAVVKHERSAFPSVKAYSLPGNEVNAPSNLFRGGESQIAAYSKACYAAIKAANSAAYVYGFELNMDGSLNAPAFIHRMGGLGCKVGTCYDGLAIHLSLRYPIPAPSTPCYPHAHGDYSLNCIADIESAAKAPIHVLISESVYPVPAYVPDEKTKAAAIVAELSVLSAQPTVDGVAYANVDECALYTSGFFTGGCLVSKSGVDLPAFGAVRALALAHFK